jgi:hypothetical protein
VAAAAAVTAAATVEMGEEVVIRARSYLAAPLLELL